MAERKKSPYDEKAKSRITRCLQKNYEQVRLTVKKGTVERYKAFAESKGTSMTALITNIMEREMDKAGFVYEPETNENTSE